jgi:hypothetical protein
MFSNLNIFIVKIQIGAMFWFENDLSFVNKKNTPKQHHRWQKMEKSKNIRTVINNNKMT